MPDFTDTIAAPATPNGTSALAVVRISGPDTLRIVEDLWRDAPPPRTVRRGDYRSVGGELIDDVLYVHLPGPRSYTGEDVLEISSHGNPFILQKILEDLHRRGCRPADPGEFTQRAFLNGRLDLSQAEGVMDVIHARSERALAAANRQLRGSLGRRMESLIAGLLEILARVEAYIDFPDEDLPVEDRSIVAGQLAALIRESSDLLATNHYGTVLREGVCTVIIGRPNVGKSSLLNRLVGSDRALVSPEPGTTRDFIEERVMIGPHWLRLIDTAGLNPSPAPLERLGIQKTVERAQAADLFLVVHEVGGERDLEASIDERLTPNNSVIVLNKSDIQVSQHPAEEGAIHVSALTGEGIDRLTSAITAKIDAFGGDANDESIAINSRHATALGTAQTALRSANENLNNSGPVELLASDLRSALTSFGEISGRVDNERMLDALFATFCVGK
ncbi:MAG: tRNA uridine-5-carboxymethylaminomethyl(34) synthesis GTPase MnmE [Opitutus sp.]